MCVCVCGQRWLDVHQFTAEGGRLLPLPGLPEMLTLSLAWRRLVRQSWPDLGHARGT